MKWHLKSNRRVWLLVCRVSDEQALWQKYFREDNRKVSFYTGLPTHEVLEATFNYVSPFVKWRTQSLTLFQEMVMVLMKLRLSVSHQDLAYRFGVSQSTVSRTFAHWLLIMDVRLSPLIRWPEREELWKTMPQCFKFSFGNKKTVSLGDTPQTNILLKIVAC